jgi:hypothetical protein
LAEHFLKARRDLRHRCAHRASVGSLANANHGRHLCGSHYYPKRRLKSNLGQCSSTTRCRWDRNLGSRPRIRFPLAVGDSQIEVQDMEFAAASL